MAETGRLIALLGLLLLLVGGAMALLGRLHLPGDLVLRRGGLTLIIPIATSLVLSIVLTIVLNLLLRGR
jgi:hypothetical protein